MILLSSTVTCRGSSAMPQIGQAPGSERMISGCIGQVYSVRTAGAGTTAGSRAMPHLEQLPGPICLTSGCIGQTYSLCCSVFEEGATVGGAFGFRYFPGSARNFETQPLPQK